MTTPPAAARQVDVLRLAGLTIGAPDLLLCTAVIEAVDVIIKIRHEAIGGDVPFADWRQDFLELTSGDINLIELVCVGWIWPAISLRPELTIDMLMQRIDHGKTSVALIPIGREQN